MYAITGATGQLGRKAVTSLKGYAGAKDVVAIARDPGKAADLGVLARKADYRDPDSLKRAFAGITKVLLISSSSLDTRQQEHANVIAAAAQAGVKHIVYTSLLHADRWVPGFAADHLKTEEMLKASGLTFTILRNGWYWENHTVALVPSLQHGLLIGSAGDAKISWASRQNFADAAVAVLSGTGHADKTYELAGNRAHTLNEMAVEAQHQAGKPLQYRNIPEAEHADFFKSVGLPGAVAAMLAEIEARGTATGVLYEDNGLLSRLIGRPTQSLSEAVAEALGHA